MENNTSKSRFKSILLDLSRIREWWVLSLAFILFAFLPHMYRINNDTFSLGILLDMLTSSELYLSIIVVFAAQIFLFAGNDYFDRHVDALDEKKCLRNSMCNGNVSGREVGVLLVATAAISLAAAMLLNIQAFIFTCFTLFVFYFYTSKPLRFKSKVGLDVLSHAALINTFPYLFCIIATWDIYHETMFLLAVLVIRSAMAQLLQEIRDYEVDKRVETNTVVVIGQKRALKIVLFLYLTMFAGTMILMLTYQLFGVGISLFYLIILFLCVNYIPTFLKLRNLMDRDVMDYRKFIDALWVGQGRTEHYSMGIRYGGSFSLYLSLVYFILI